MYVTCNVCTRGLAYMHVDTDLLYTAESLDRLRRACISGLQAVLPWYLFVRVTSVFCRVLSQVSSRRVHTPLHRHAPPPHLAGVLSSCVSVDTYACVPVDMASEELPRGV